MIYKVLSLQKVHFVFQVYNSTQPLNCSFHQLATVSCVSADRTPCYYYCYVDVFIGTTVSMSYVIQLGAIIVVIRACV